MIQVIDALRICVSFGACSQFNIEDNDEEGPIGHFATEHASGHSRWHARRCIVLARTPVGYDWQLCRRLTNRPSPIRTMLPTAFEFGEQTR